jgi:hypothetical protein
LKHQVQPYPRRNPIHHFLEDLGAFFESLPNIGLGFGVSGTQSQLAPPMPVQQTTDVGQRHGALGDLLQLGMQLRGGENLVLAGGLLPLLQEALFLLPR